jgi:AcrR family transcriptional regulator
MSTTSRQAATAARKYQIIRAAIALLAERGYQATTFEAICDKAGLSSKRLITYHFSSKDELFAAIADQIVTEADAHLRPALDTATGARELLAALIRTTVRFVAGHSEQMRALQQIILNGGHAWDRHHLDSLNRLTDLFDNGQRTGAFRPCNSLIMAAALQASLNSTYGLLSAGLDPEQCANELIELFDRATRAA